MCTKRDRQRNTWKDAGKEERVGEEGERRRQRKNEGEGRGGRNSSEYNTNNAIVTKCIDCAMIVAGFDKVYFAFRETWD